MRSVWDGETLRFTHTITRRKFRQLQAIIVMVGLTRFDDIRNNLGIAPTEAARDFEPELRALCKWGPKWTTLPSAEPSS